MKIFLIGFMGSGKSKKGKKLASLLNYVFVDMDEWIEQQEGCSITEIFSKHGEEYFRKIEYGALQKIIEMENVVISTGGGTPCYFDAMQLIKNNGVSVYLQATPAHLKNRLMLSKKKRPLVENLNEEELQTYIENKLQEREKFYSQAHHSISAVDLKAEQLLSILQPYIFSK